MVGQSGGSKSTISDLLNRFHDIEKGKNLIDQTNIKDIGFTNLRELIGVVTQDSILFNDTIYNNIKLGKINASEKEIINAAKTANAHSFILETEKGYDTNIGDRGDKLSGGQKQKICIIKSNTLKILNFDFVKRLLLKHEVRKACSRSTRKANEKQNIISYCS